VDERDLKKAMAKTDAYLSSKKPEPKVLRMKRKRAK